MAITTGARAKSLAWVGSGAPTSPLSSIQDWSFNRSKELAEFTLGTARVKSHYAGLSDAEITIQTSNLALLTSFSIGQKLTGIVLTVEGAVDSGDTAESDVTITLSHGVVTAVGELSHANDNSSPIVGSLTIKLSRHVGQSDPTVTIAAGA